MFFCRFLDGLLSQCISSCVFLTARTRSYQRRFPPHQGFHRSIPHAQKTKAPRTIFKPADFNGFHAAVDNYNPIKAFFGRFGRKPV